MVNYTLTMQNSANCTSTPASGANVYAAGTAVTCTAIPTNVNYGLDYWTIGGTFYSRVNPIVVTMDTNYTVKCWCAARTHNKSRHNRPAWRKRREAGKGWHGRVP